MSKLGTFTRRSFLIGSAAIVGGVLFGVYKYKKPLDNPLLDSIDEGVTSLNPYLKIDSRGVTIITPRAEMGQGIHSMLAMLVAEELDIDWESIQTEHGPASNAYYNSVLLESLVPYSQYDHSKKAERMRAYTQIPAKFLGIQITGGSTSTLDGFEKMRSAGASARIALIEAAANTWKVKSDSLTTESGFVVNPSNDERLSYVELAEAAAKVEALTHPPLRDPSTWRYLGKSMPRIDMVSKCTGTAQFGLDVKQDDMLYASVRMSPKLGSSIKSLDSSKTERMRGVKKVINFGTGVAIVTDNTWRAFQAVNALDIEWEDAPYPPNDAEIREVFVNSFNEEPNGEHENIGDVDAALNDAEDVFEAEYWAPFLAHATMEPMTAVAQVTDDRIDIWTGTQSPTNLRAAIAGLSAVDSSKIHIHTQYLGGGFGRRSESDFGLLAYRVAAEAEGKPVKVTWSREEDMRHDFYRPAGIARFKGVMGDSKPTAIDVKIASPSIMGALAKRGGPPVMGADVSIVEGTASQAEQIDNYRIRAYSPKIEIPIGFWRSVGASHNGFFHETFMDEMAALKGLDPIVMRLEMMADLTPTGRKVVEKVAEISGWGKTPHSEGVGQGFAYTQSFGAHTAQVIDVRMTDKGIKIEKVYCAVDVGTALDPKNIEAQIQSGIIFGLSSAMTGDINFKEGEVQQTNFHNYVVMRMNQIPEIDVAILENNPTITGVGEPGTPPSLPALGNAIYAATGKRIRSLPMNRDIKFA